MVKYFTEVVADELFIYVERSKFVSRFATVNIQHAFAQERVNWSVLVFCEREWLVLSARRMEAEFASNGMSVEILDFKSVGR